MSLIIIHGIYAYICLEHVTVYYMTRCRMHNTVRCLPGAPWYNIVGALRSPSPASTAISTQLLRANPSYTPTCSPGVLCCYIVRTSLQASSVASSSSSLPVYSACLGLRVGAILSYRASRTSADPLIDVSSMGSARRGLFIAMDLVPAATRTPSHNHNVEYPAIRPRDHSQLHGAPQRSLDVRAKNRDHGAWSGMDGGGKERLEVHQYGRD